MPILIGLLIMVFVWWKLLTCVPLVVGFIIVWTVWHYLTKEESNGL